MDSVLVEAIRMGDETAFDTLFRTYYPALCRYAAPMLDGDLDDAEDVVQQVFVKIWETRQTLDIQWSVKAYLYKMVHHRSLNKRRRALVSEQYKAYNAQQLAEGQQPVEQEERELRERLQKALEKLPTECRKVFELSRFESLKYREIAESLQISIKTVETQMGKALRLMRTELADYLVAMLWFLIGSGVGLKTLLNTIFPFLNR